MNYFEEISEIRYSDVTVMEHESFTQDEIGQITRIKGFHHVPALSFEIEFVERSGPIHPKTRPKRSVIKIIFELNRIQIFNIFIHKLKDECYWIYWPPINPKQDDSFYKCDQFFGLMQLLNEKFSVTDPKYWGIGEPDEKISESIDNEYYQEIDEDDFYHLNKEKEEIKESEISKIKSIVPSNVMIKKWIGATKKGEQKLDRVSRLSLSWQLNDRMTGEIRIDKYEDEWIYVFYSEYRTITRGLTGRNSYKYYKCDQMDGLIKLISTFFPIKESKLNRIKLFEEYNQDDLGFKPISYELVRNRI